MHFVRGLPYSGDVQAIWRNLCGMSSKSYSRSVACGA